MTFLSDFRFLDQAALALERGLKGVLDKVPDAKLQSVGALVEAAILSRTTRTCAPIVRRFENSAVVRALRAAEKSALHLFGGKSDGAAFGFMSLKALPADELREPVYALQLAARKAMVLKRDVDRTKARLSGAIGEMVDNVLDHSGDPSSALIGFYGDSERFEVAVGDAGVGVLASLRTNPKFSYLQDEGSAMSVAIQNGNSRYGPVQDRGYGFGTLFRALNTLDAGVRLRSGDYALETFGRKVGDRIPEASQKATLRGFVVSFTLQL